MKPRLFSYVQLFYRLLLLAQRTPKNPQTSVVAAMNHKGAGHPPEKSLSMPTAAGPHAPSAYPSPCPNVEVQTISAALLDLREKNISAAPSIPP